MTIPTTLIDIPYTPFGLLDTVSLRLNTRFDDRDTSSLLTHGFTTRKDVASNTSNGYSSREWSTIDFVRECDGSRVSLREHYVSVEGSLPRVLGFMNDQQDLVFESDALRALRSLTEDILPYTTAAAASAAMPTGWYLTRLDLAINLAYALLPRLIELHRFSRHPRIRKFPSVCAGNFLLCFGSRYEIIIYDPSRKYGRTQMEERVRGKHFRKHSQTCRVEFRFKDKTSLARLSPLLNDSGPGLPILSSDSHGGPRIRFLPMSNHLLHSVLATEVARFARPKAASTSLKSAASCGYKNLIMQQGILRVSEHPEVLAECQATMSPRTFSKIEDAVRNVRVVEDSLDIIALAWPVEPTELPPSLND